MSKRATILVIDDEPGIRDMLVHELSQEGFEVEAAENGLAGVEAVKRRRFDLAITDFRMPGMNGAETVEALRAVDPDLAVIVATGYASLETTDTFMKSGAFDYIEKPFDLPDLLSLLEAAMTKGCGADRVRGEDVDGEESGRDPLQILPHEGGDS